MEELRAPAERPAAHEHEIAAVPAPVRAVVDVLADAGHAAVLVGGCVRDWLAGRPAEDFDVATSARPDAVLAAFANAVPIGLRHGTVMVPTPAGPVDVTSFRAGPRLEDDLAHRDFTINAIAYDPRRRELVDPFGGRADLLQGRLRAVGSAVARFAEDPLRALRAARLAALLALEVAPEVERAMGEAGPALEALAAERVRQELAGLLLAPGAAEGLELLRRTGLEARLAPGAPRDASAVVAGLPCELAVRLAGWLRGTRAGAILRGLRFPKRVVREVEQLLSLHPVEERVVPGESASLRQLLRRASPAQLRALLALRRAELGAAGAEATRLARLAELEAEVERLLRAGSLALRRFDLAIDGAEVMARLRCGPGPRVGQALRYLTGCVIEDPARNTPEALRALLDAWAREH